MTAVCAVCNLEKSVNEFDTCHRGYFTRPDGKKSFYACKPCTRVIEYDANHSIYALHPTLNVFISQGGRVFRAIATDAITGKTRILSHDAIIARDQNYRLELVGCINPAGYVVVYIGKLVKCVHRLVFETLSGQAIVPGNVIMHNDDCKTNNFMANLSQGTQSENLHQAFVHGLTNKFAPVARRIIVTNGTGQMHFKSAYAAGNFMHARRNMVLRICHAGGGTLHDFEVRFA